MINMGKPKAQRAAEDAPEPRQPRSLSLGNNPVPTSHKNSSSWMPSGARTNRAIALKRKKKSKQTPCGLFCGGSVCLVWCFVCLFGFFLMQPLSCEVWIAIAEIQAMGKERSRAGFRPSKTQIQPELPAV